MKSDGIGVSLGTGHYRHIRVGEQERPDRLHEVILDVFDFGDDHAHVFFPDDRYWIGARAYYPDYADDSLSSHTHKHSSRGNTPEALTALNYGGQKTAAFGISKESRFDPEPGGSEEFRTESVAREEDKYCKSLPSVLH